MGKFLDSINASTVTPVGRDGRWVNETELTTTLELLSGSFPFSGETLAPQLLGTRHEPFNFTPMGVNLISSGSPHARCTPMGVHRTCGEPDETKKNTHPKCVAAFFRHQVVKASPTASSTRRAGSTSTMS